ncbi:MAG TPA: family 43 glycosylhydrolase, partial [Kofleriaceae bacterium]|nr:family 43 glycosylhydrolase [Kofleriaceae bacterium]
PHAGAVFARADAAGVWGPGSNAFFRSPDGSEDWIVYHAKNTAAYAYDLRTTRAQRIGWTADNEPDLGVPLAASATQLLPAGDPGRGTLAIDDTDAAMTFDASWTAYPSCGTQCYRGGDHGSATAGAAATVQFTGTQVMLISARDAGNGIAAVSLDGSGGTMCDQYAAIRQGEQVTYTSPRLPYGPHVVTVRVTGQKSAASSGFAVSIDRAEIYSE